MARARSRVALILLLSALMPGCSAPGDADPATGGERSDSSRSEPPAEAQPEWRAVAEAFQSRNRSVIVVGLFDRDPTAPDAQRIPLSDIEVSGVHVTDVEGTHEVSVSSILIPPDGGVELRLDRARYQDAGVDAVLILEGGERVHVPDAQWVTLVWSPWRLSTSVNCSDGAVQLFLHLYEREAGKTGTTYVAGGRGSMRPLVPDIAQIEAWRVNATDPNGTRTIVSTFTIQEQTNTVRSSTGLTTVEDLSFAFRIRLMDGTTLTEHDFEYAMPDRLKWDARC